MQLSRFAKYAWVVLGYNLLVIMWGAFVRATGSGAGCGSHWPLCNGQVLPRAPQIETLIEFSHRLTSGVLLPLIIGLVVWAYRRSRKGDPVRMGAVLSLFFVCTEALVGAALVKFELVGDNASVMRAVVISIHLVNTFILTAALSLTAWWASGGLPVRLRGQGGIAVVLGLTLFGTLVLGMTGAVTALGDTLFPEESLRAGIAQDFAPNAHFLRQLRVVHPTLAIVLGGLIVLVAGLVYSLRPAGATKRFAQLVAILYATQIMVGSLNLILLVPTWMQLIHLLVADLVWIALVLMSATTLGVAPQPNAAVPPVAADVPYAESLRPQA